MKLFGAGGAAHGPCFDALCGLREPAAVLDAGGRVLFANRALVSAQGCLPEGGTCRETGRRPCEGCLMAGEMDEAPAVRHGGCVWERTVSPFESAGARGSAVLWRDRTALAESTALMGKQYGKMRRDIFHARSIQYSLLPKEHAQFEGYVFRSLYKPSEEMSGDIFDILRIGRDNMAFYIADVAGHGVTAAMLTLFFSTAVRLEMRPLSMPGDVLSRIQSRFMELELEEHHYITAFLGRLELSTGNLYWSNAGHICPPVLMDADGNASMLETAGLPVSRWFPDQRYETAEGRLDMGGRLMLYSDGLEARWHDSGAGGGLDETVGRILREAPAEDCLEAIWGAACAGARDTANRDDTTLLLVHRLAGGGSGGGC